MTGGSSPGAARALADRRWNHSEATPRRRSRPGWSAWIRASRAALRDVWQLDQGGGAVNEPSPPGDKRLPPTLARQVDQVCDRYEAAWKAGRRPRIDDYLGNLPEPGRAGLLRELLGLELVYRHRAGERPTPEEYQTRFPDADELITAVFD